MEKLLLALATALILSPAAAQATETTTYNYDALGRLIAEDHTGTVNAGLSVDLTYDPAGNRKTYVSTGTTPPAPAGLIATPLGKGYMIIPLPN